MTDRSGERRFLLLCGVVIFYNLYGQDLFPIGDISVSRNIFKIAFLVLGFIGISFFAGASWKKMMFYTYYDRVVQFLSRILPPFLLATVAARFYHKGLNHLFDLSSYILFILIAFVLPFFIGLRISQKVESNKNQSDIRT